MMSPFERSSASDSLVATVMVSGTEIIRRPRGGWFTFQRGAASLRCNLFCNDKVVGLCRVNNVLARWKLDTFTKPMCASASAPGPETAEDNFVFPDGPLKMRKQS